jgi:hypothetical protein
MAVLMMLLHVRDVPELKWQQQQQQQHCNCPDQEQH